jgi:hypothetical protein
MQEGAKNPVQHLTFVDILLDERPTIQTTNYPY